MFSGDDLCDPSDRPLYEQLYESVMTRNGRLKKCLAQVNEKFVRSFYWASSNFSSVPTKSINLQWINFQFATSVCLPFPVEVGMEYNSALLRWDQRSILYWIMFPFRVLSANYTTSSECFHDANLIQVWIFITFGNSNQKLLNFRRNAQNCACAARTLIGEFNINYLLKLFWIHTFPGAVTTRWTLPKSKRSSHRLPRFDLPPLNIHQHLDSLILNV